MSTATTFEEAAALVGKLASKPTDEELLAIYGLYKQATTGDINIDQPWAIQVEARKKWEAWNEQKGKTQEEAKTQYIALANEAVKSYGVKSE